MKLGVQRHLRRSAAAAAAAKNKFPALSLWQEEEGAVI